MEDKHGRLGHRNFSNDSALDYVADVSAVEDLQRAIEAVPVDPEKEIEADSATQALAAAEILASMIGRPAPDQPEEVKNSSQHSASFKKYPGERPRRGGSYPEKVRTQRPLG